MSVCKIEEGDAGRAVPRTCPTCKLSGACHKGLDRKAQAAKIARLYAALDAMTAERDAAFNALQFYAGALYGGNIDGTGCAFGRHQGQDVWDRGEIAAAAIHAMKAHNADLGATLDARVQAARAAVAFVRNVAQSAMTAEHDQDERETLLDLDTLRFQRDCDISAARDIRAMIEQAPQVPEAPTGQEDKG